MWYRTLGKAGIKVSVLGWGNYLSSEELTDERTYYIMKGLFSQGINLFDTAEMYGDGKAEMQLGYAIKKGLEEGVWKRSNLVICTKIFKCGHGVNDVGLSRKHIIEGLEQSLSRLNIKYVDLVLCHRPDNLTMMEETVRAMSYLVDKGLALYWGTSEWSAYQIAEAYTVARQYNLIPPTLEEPQYNMFNRNKVEQEYLKLYSRDVGLGIIGYSVLWGGLLSGKYSENVFPEGSRLSKDFPQQEFLSGTPQGKDILHKIGLLSELAKEMNVTMSQLAIGWSLLNNNVSSVLFGGYKDEQLMENIKSVEVAVMLIHNPNYVDRIEAILQNKPVVESHFGR